MKHRLITQILLLPGFFFLAANSYLSAQYLETFSTPGKGYLLSLQDSLKGVNWSLSTWALDDPGKNIVGRDATDYFATTPAGKLECIDLDHEVYWESPLINIANSGTVSMSVDLTWLGFDGDVVANTCTSGGPGVVASLDLIKVMYSINGGAYTLVANQAGGASCATIAYLSGATGTDGSTKVSVMGLTGTNIKIRIIINTNANAEVVSIDNVNIPQNGVFVACTAPAFSIASGNPSSFTICTEYKNNDFVISTTDNNLDMKLVSFSSKQTGSNMYSGGTMLGTVQSPIAGTVSFNENAFPTPGIYYIYAILDTSDPDLTSTTCRPSFEFIVTVTEKPNPSIEVMESSETANDGTIISGAEVSLTVKEEGNFTWSTGGTSKTIIVAPTATTTYTVTVRRDVCQATASQVITVKPRTTPTTDLSADGYYLKQNIPNPFSTETSIGFSLPRAMKATLMVRDLKGALLYRQTGNFAKGDNKLVLKKDQLGSSGILYYTLETIDYVVTKKMVILQ